MCSGYLCFSVVYMWRLVFLTKCGQELINSMKKGKKSLEDFMILHEVDPVSYKSLKILEKRLSNHSPLSPGSAFALSNKGLVTTFSVLLTYIIVLIQFKLSGS